MKKFLAKICISGVIAILFLALIEVLSLHPKTARYIDKLTNSTGFRESGTGYEEVGESILGVQQNDGTTKLVLGDSIARQLFKEREHDDQTSIQCSSAAICITGQYMLAMDWLNCHENATDIYLYMHPTSLARTIEAAWGYPYVVIPFGLYDKLGYLDGKTIKDMESVYGGLFMKKPVIRLINDSALNRKMYLTYMQRKNKEYEQSNSFEISEFYLIKLKEECETRGVTLHLLCTPSTEFQKKTIEELREEYNQTRLVGEFPDYIKDIYYYSDDYTNDYMHLSPEYATREFMDQIMEEAFGEANLP